ncbi:MAG TPA: hypothetical protein VJ180_00415 [Pyrinomonadaceae bacterium]|nr:hypothetical protein [Pyrinomonadaceae bacterium]
MMIPAQKLEIIVALSDFVGILKAAKYGAKLGKRNIARENVEFHFDGAHLIVTIVGVNRTIPASGSWEGKVAVALSFMGGLNKFPPTQSPLTISYENSKLKIGTTSFPAEWTQ